LLHFLGELSTNQSSLLKTQCKARQAQAWSVNWAKFCLASLSSPGWNSALLSFALWLVTAKLAVCSDWSPPNWRKFPKNNHSTLSILQKVKLAPLFCGKNDETCWPSYLGGCTSPTTGYVNFFTKKRPKIGNFWKFGFVYLFYESTWSRMNPTLIKTWSTEKLVSKINLTRSNLHWLKR
jgi:hypothetical protein